MKKKDLFHIAALKLKNKNSKRMIVAMAFGLIMLAEVFWLIFAFNVDLYLQINKSPINNLMLIESNVQDELDVRGKLSENLFRSDNGRQLTVRQKSLLPVASEEVSWTEVQLNRNGQLNDQIYFTIDDEKKVVPKALMVKFINEADGKTHPQSIENYLSETNGHGAIYGNGFGNEKRELYLSETLAESLGFSAADALGKVISITIDYVDVDLRNQRYILDNDTNSENDHIKSYDQEAEFQDFSGKIQIITNFRVAGVISREYYAVNNLTETDADIWMKEDVLFTDAGESVLPKITLQDLYVYTSKTAAVVLTYPSIDYITLSEQLTAQGCFFPFFIGNDYISDNNRGANNFIMPLITSYVQCESFSAAKDYAQMVNEFTANNGGNVGNFYSPCSHSFIKLWQLSDTINALSIALAVVGGITLLTVTVNYGNIMCFNARKRKGFLEMMRKIGITEKEKALIVSLETFGGFALAALIAFIVGIIVSVLIKLICVWYFAEFEILSGISIALWPFVLVFFVISALMLTAMWLISVKANK